VFSVNYVFLSLKPPRNRIFSNKIMYHVLGSGLTLFEVCAVDKGYSIISFHSKRFLVGACSLSYV